MSKLSRSSVFEILGVRPTNPRWSWCAVSPDNSTVVFTIWSDRMAHSRTRLLPEPTRVSNGAIDQRKIVDRAIATKMKAYGLVCVATDPAASPRKISMVESEYLIPLRLVREGDQVYAIHLAQISIGEFLKQAKRRSGVIDLDIRPPGSDFPDRAEKTGFVVLRDEKVRKAVLARAFGCCEFCGKKGFMMASGKRYLEAHHIIALANQGRDRVGNVIALCPEHHREAHYGKDAVALEAQFINRIEQLLGKG